MISKIKKRPILLALVSWFFVMWSWSFVTDSLELANSKKHGLILAIIVVAANVAISTAIVLFLLKRIASIHRQIGDKKFLIIGLPLFALLDFLVCWGTTIIWIGPQGNLDNILPMGSLALPLVNTPLAFVARFVGFYGLAAFGWLILYFFFQTTIHKELLGKLKKTKVRPLSYRRKLALVPLSVAVVGSVIGWCLYKTPNGVPVSATLISETITKRVPAVNPIGIDLVIFPEYGLEKVTNQNLKDRVTRTSNSQKTTYFLGSEQIFFNNKVGHKNNMMFGNTKDGIVERQDKYRLIPGGEDLPYNLRVLLRATGQRDTLDYFSYAKSVLKGENQLQPFIISDDIVVAAAVCSSIIAPQDYRDFAQSGATLFTNSASLSTFKGSRIFAWQQKSMARFMAIANSRYFLQSANAASAYALDNNGKQQVEVRGHNTVNTVAITNTKKTFYTIVGEWFVILGAFILGGFVLKNHGKQWARTIRQKAKTISARFATMKR